MTDDSGAGPLAGMSPCSATAGDGDADTAGRTKPDCDIPPVPDPDSGDAELPNAANKPMDEERPGPARPTPPLLPMSPTAATDAGLELCAGGGAVTAMKDQGG